MSGGHWNYLSHRIEERIGVPLDDVWHLLAAVEHELDWGICCDTCYDCAKIRVINALEAYFDTEATSVENSLRLLQSHKPECGSCKFVRAANILQGYGQQQCEPQEVSQAAPPRESATVEFLQNGKMYKGVVYVEE